jgi:hypothetical protein
MATDWMLTKYMCKIANIILKITPDCTEPKRTGGEYKPNENDFLVYFKEIFNLGELVFSNVRTQFSSYLNCTNCEFTTCGQYMKDRMQFHNRLYHSPHELSQNLVDLKLLQDQIHKMKILGLSNEIRMLMNRYMKRDWFVTPKYMNQLEQFLPSILQQIEKPKYMHSQACNSSARYYQYLVTLGELFYSAMPKHYTEKVTGIRCAVCRKEFFGPRHPERTLGHIRYMHNREKIQASDFQEMISHHTHVASTYTVADDIDLVSIKVL